MVRVREVVVWEVVDGEEGMMRKKERERMLKRELFLFSLFGVGICFKVRSVKVK
jgi:hypothetical protein